MTQWQHPQRLQESDTDTELVSNAGRGLVDSSGSSVADLVKRQLSEVDLTDAASMLVLAVATATAVTPAERARAGLFPWPYYFIGTRDSFTHELVPMQSLVRDNNYSLQCIFRVYVTGIIFMVHAVAALCWTSARFHAIYA